MSYRRVHPQRPFGGRGASAALIPVSNPMAPTAAPLPALFVRPLQRVFRALGWRVATATRALRQGIQTNPTRVQGVAAGFGCGDGHGLRGLAGSGG